MRSPKPARARRSRKSRRTSPSCWRKSNKHRRDDQSSNAVLQLRKSNQATLSPHDASWQTDKRQQQQTINPSSLVAPARVKLAIPASARASQSINNIPSSHAKCVMFSSLLSLLLFVVAPPNSGLYRYLSSLRTRLLSAPRCLAPRCRASLRFDFASRLRLRDLRCVPRFSPRAPLVRFVQFIRFAKDSFSNLVCSLSAA